jgi:hypothetical protein
MKDIVLSWLFFIISGALVLQWLILMENVKDIKKIRKSYSVGESTKLAEIKFLESKNSNYIGANAWVGFGAALTFIVLFIVLPIITKMEAKCNGGCK